MADLTLYGFRVTAFSLSAERATVTVEVLLKASGEVIETFRASQPLRDGGRDELIKEVKRRARRIATVHGDQTGWFEQQLGIVRDL